MISDYYPQPDPEDMAMMKSLRQQYEHRRELEELATQRDEARRVARRMMRERDEALKKLEEIEQRRLDIMEYNDQCAWMTLRHLPHD